MKLRVFGTQLIDALPGGPQQVEDVRVVELGVGQLLNRNGPVRGGTFARHQKILRKGFEVALIGGNGRASHILPDHIETERVQQV